MFDAIDCQSEPIYSYILGICLCITGILSYLPQYYSLIKSGQTTGISEISLLILNVGGATLAANSFILNYWKFECYERCSALLCTANLLPLIQIFIGWIVVLPLYIIFIRFKIQSSKKRLLSDIRFILSYMIFVILMLIFGVVDKIYFGNTKFFQIAAISLGIISAICSCIVWLPQIIKLIQTQEAGGLSLLMFGLQTPGNIMIIILQILYKQNWSTWITYLVLLIEQSTIVIILLIFKYRELRNQRIINVSLSEINDP
ncbi:PQ loop repeat protein [Indivirus ILV1]|uniref:PQ loop repeat protein n=1 Tax=Indivirus ILV1 TaxID=1977633 RepID=A0A1V0SE55_9VIRU|nr:PQ loop repeat protein [Indivirus ILV1]